MYLLALIIGLSASYFVIAALFSLLFSSALPAFSAKSIRSTAIIGALAAVIIAWSINIPDAQIGNRILHAMGGGFLVVVVCFLAVRDIEVPIGKLRFCVMSILIAASFGVMNELIEFFLQSYFNLVFIRTPDDTWLDLTSNTVGTVLAAAIFTPFVRKNGTYD